MMKCKYYSILNLVVILFYILRPVFPYIDYVINKEYIVKNLCVEKDNPENDCQGTCHLHEQLNRQSEPQDAERKDNNKLVPGNKIDDHVKAISKFPVLFPNEINISGFYLIFINEGFISDIFNPPKF
jgi:hypothetical protein